MAKYVMALDSGTTSNRCILFDESGRIRSVAQKEFIQHFPKPGWVEHDAGEIWSTQLSVDVYKRQVDRATDRDTAAGRRYPCCFTCCETTDNVYPGYRII